jgi:hypothetical protein
MNVEDLTSFTDVVHQKAIQSIEDAEKAMSKARGDLEKAKASKEDRNNVVSKANEVASTLLAPGRHAVHLLAGHGVLFPPCKDVSKALAVRVSSSPSDTSLTYILLMQTLIKGEAGQRENDVRVAVVHFDLVRHLSEEHDWPSNFST